ncbi:MAG: hypothetical protein ACC608_09585 [Anaerofustis sp.]
MLDVKEWLKTTGLAVEETSFEKKTQLPYIIFTEKRDIGGADIKNNVAVRSITVEFYSERKNPIAEKAIEDLFDAKAISYVKDRIWLGGSDNFFETIYDFSITEKI